MVRSSFARRSRYAFDNFCVDHMDCDDCDNSCVFVFIFASVSVWDEDDSTAYDCCDKPTKSNVCFSLSSNSGVASYITGIIEFTDRFKVANGLLNKPL